MNKHYLHSKMKSTGIAYLCWFFLGFHYAYMGKWVLQTLYWITCGGAGVWTVIDIFLIPSMVDNHNLKISIQIQEIENREKSCWQQTDKIIVSKKAKTINERYQ